jgi:NTP pyrophosphatase (non-canonical NTP hydrolase)
VSDPGYLPVNKPPIVDLRKAYNVKKKSGIKKKVVRDMHEEMNRASVKHGWAMTPLNAQMPDGQKLVILAEEVGEVAEAMNDADPEMAIRMRRMAKSLGKVARAMTYDNGDQEMLYRELIQVATMAGAWAQSLKARKTQDWVTT